MSEHILIKSQDKTANSTSSSNFQIRLPQVFSGKYLVNHIAFPNSLLNVITGFNDIVYTSVGNVTLDEGRYTASTLASHVQTKLQALNANFTCGYSSTNEVFTISYNTNFTLNWGTNTVASARKLLGFSANDTTSATSASSDQQIDLAPIKSVVIRIDECNPNVYTSSIGDNPSNIYVAVREAFGDVINQTRSEIIQHITLRRTNTLNIKVYDNNGNIISLRGLDWEILLSKE